MNSTDKNTIVSKLYLLKAILSKISCNQDKIDENEGCTIAFLESNEAKVKAINEQFERRNKLQINSDELRQLTNERKTHEKNVTIIQKRIEENQKKIDELEQDISWGRNLMQTIGRLLTHAILPALIPLLIVIGLVVAFINFKEIWMIVVAAIVFIGSIIGYIKWLDYDMPFWDASRYLMTQKKLKDHELWIKIHKAEINEDKLKLRDERNAFTTAKYEEEILEARLREERLNKLIQDRESRLQSAKQEEELQLQALTDCNSKFVVENKALYAMAKETASLDERDWKNLDLIIYELETNRADSIKEALQQADLYIRHNEMKKVMQTATVAICSTIKESIGELSRSIGTSLLQLRADISLINSNLSEMNESNKELSEKFDDLVNAQELGNALLKKANVSSEQLAQDVRRMRVIRDEEYYRT